MIYNNQMKIIFLNAWEGKAEEINEFILKQSSDTDIFCFQESFNLKSQVFCLDLLKGYRFYVDQKRVNSTDNFSNCTFIKNDISVLNTQTIGQGDLSVGLGIFNQIKTSDNKILNLCNFHGHARPGGKQDTPDRIRQSQLIVNFFEDISGPKIIGGDFNLDLNIKSVQMIEENGFRNLIKEFNIPTTRNETAWAQHEDKQLYADYVFVSPDIKVTRFSVPSIEISDHLPLILEVEL